MSNSPLTVHTNISPNRSSPRSNAISKITPHHAAGVIGIESLGAWFSKQSTQASANYGIDSDGRKALYVEEKDRAWTSSSSANDNQAVTIEISNSATGGDWPISDKAYSALIDLCEDIWKRNPGIRQADGTPGLYYDGTPNGSLTVHRMFKATNCPGPYLDARLAQICSDVNKRLSAMADTSTLTKIAGTSIASAGQMTRYIKARNPNVAQSVVDMIPLYIIEGKAEGIRGDVAFSQSCLETGNFTFTGSAVTLDQNNFCGLGVTSNGMKGNSFINPATGIRAQVQHLKAYANKDPVVGTLVDPRFSYVARGSAEFVDWLGQKENPGGAGWAAGEKYGEKILAILAAILQIEEENDMPLMDEIRKIQGLDKVTDKEVADWIGYGLRQKAPTGAAVEDFEAAKKAGITDGSNPGGPVTRWQAAVMAFRAGRAAK